MSSSDSGSDGESETFNERQRYLLLPLSENELWADVDPVPQDDGPEPAVPIAYSTQFVDIMNYFRGILKRDERTFRGFLSTEAVISVNAANYTAWFFRRLCMERLLRDRDAVIHYRDDDDEITPVPLHRLLFEELQMCERVARKNSKNYQLWHHRKLVLQRALHGAQASLAEASVVPGLQLGEGKSQPTLEPSKDDTGLSPANIRRLLQSELELCDSFLDIDGKNYHVWSYRQWMCRVYGNKYCLWGAEWSSLLSLIKDDVRNNSAWNHRHVVLTLSGAHAECATRSNDRDESSSDTTEIKSGACQWCGYEQKDKGGTRNRAGDALSLSLSQDMAVRECEYTLQKLQVCPVNESAWNYLEAIITQAIPMDSPVVGAVCEHIIKCYVEPDHQKQCGVLLNALSGEQSISLSVECSESKEPTYPRFAYALVVLMCEKVQPSTDIVNLHAGLCGLLARVRDVIRRNYWMYRGNAGLPTVST